ncbi:MAG: hypothetical protein K2Y56_23530 [Methylobacterium sp.]|uniref:hypothetical protein n=1 Tax=Methylobacterium sp. TaxID=409 RepID=UPI0025CF34B1|nr:hypothetical protein [Methylobacterium sp.]MBX9934449.1 hypothetical protein [Methylobacterium sp.]
MFRNPPAASLATFVLATFVLAASSDAAHAADAAASLILPWGDTIIALAQTATSLLLPLAIAGATAAMAQIAGPLRILITSALVERLVRNAADYAVNAVAGAVRGQTLEVPIASQVIARAVQRGIDQAPGWLMSAAGGPAGLADKVFRSLPLAPAATAANTLAPALIDALAPRTRAGRSLP